MYILYFFFISNFEFSINIIWKLLSSLESRLSNNFDEAIDFILDMNFTSKQKLATLVEGDPKAPFSIATTSRCSGGTYSFP